MRGYLLFIVAMGFLGALVGRIGPSLPAHRATIVVPANEASQGEPVSAPTTTTAPQFSSEDGSIELRRSGNGHFYADVRINNAIVHMLIDTGATGIALSRSDAQSAGVATSIGMNDVVGEGADGAVHGQYVRLDRVELGPLSASGLDAIVLNSGEQSLLGQSFLSKFAKVQIEGDRMILRQT